MVNLIKRAKHRRSTGERWTKALLVTVVVVAQLAWVWILAAGVLALFR
jgi:hypothetical protein